MSVIQEDELLTKKILLLGNPNVGKSVIFNKLTGVNQRIANFPGITLSYLSGGYINERDMDIIDLPGIYGLTSSKAEEKLTQQYLLENKPDLILNILDGRKLERNLALTLQLLDFQIPMILILTHSDQLDAESIDLPKLQSLLGIPVFAIDSHKKSDYKDLQIAIRQIVDGNIEDLIPKPVQLELVDDLIADMDHSIFNQPVLLHQDQSFPALPPRVLLIITILSGIDQMSTLPSWLQARIEGFLNDRFKSTKELQSFRLNLLRSYYSTAEILVAEVTTEDYTYSRRSIISQLDDLLVHPTYGLIIFTAVMYLTFSLTFVLTDPLVSWLELSMGELGIYIKIHISSALLASFLADGIIGGVGFVLVFIPQIAILFLFIGLLEHTGYLSRAVFITDRYLEKIGISGTSIAPLLLGFGCNVPGVMATKSISDPNERIVVGLVNPFMSCSARLPVYMIIASAIFPQYVGIVVTSLYFIGIIIAISVMYLLRNSLLPGESQYLLLEIPELQVPKLDPLLKQSYRHTRKFLENAASWMALGLIIIWVLSITGPRGYIGPSALDDASLIPETWIYFIGKIVSPVFGPMGWDPRLIVALIMGFVAKEIVIGSLGLLYGVKTTSLHSVLLMSFNPVSAYAFMVFVLIYTPCIGTYFAMRAELGKKWANFSIIFSIILAYLLALLITVIGNLFT